MNAVGRFGAGFMVGIVLIVAVAAFTGSDDHAVSETTITTTTGVPVVETEPWFAPGEILIGATVLLPQSLDVEDGIAYLDYDLVGMAPTLFGDDGTSDMPVGDVLALPESWELTTDSGQTVIAQTGIRDTSVKFELPAGTDEVAKITLTGWRVPVPFGDSVTLAVAEGASGELRSGTVTVSVVLEQSISTIVQIDFDDSDDPWQIEDVIRPADPHWQASGRQGGGLQLTWMGGDAPESVVVEDVGYERFPISGNILVYEDSSSP